MGWGRCRVGRAVWAATIQSVGIAVRVGWWCLASVGGMFLYEGVGMGGDICTRERYQVSREREGFSWRVDCLLVG